MIVGFPSKALAAWKAKPRLIRWIVAPVATLCVLTAGGASAATLVSNSAAPATASPARHRLAGGTARPGGRRDASPARPARTPRHRARCPSTAASPRCRPGRRSRSTTRRRPPTAPTGSASTGRRRPRVTSPPRCGPTRRTRTAQVTLSTTGLAAGQLRGLAALRRRLRRDVRRRHLHGHGRDRPPETGPSRQRHHQRRRGAADQARLHAPTRDRQQLDRPLQRGRLRPRGLPDLHLRRRTPVAPPPSARRAWRRARTRRTCCTTTATPSSPAR